MEFTLRPFTANDAASLAKNGDNPKIAENMTDQFPNPYTEERAKGFIEFANQHDPPYILAIEVNGEAAGGIGLHPQEDVWQKNIELGYWLAEPYWGNGIITRAISQMVDYGFENWDFQRIFARPYGPNIGSIKALEKAGFKLEATFENIIYKNGEYLDELVYAVRRDTLTL